MMMLTVTASTIRNVTIFAFTMIFMVISNIWQGVLLREDARHVNVREKRRWKAMIVYIIIIIIIIVTFIVIP